MSEIKEMDKNEMIKRNFDRPPIKDTVTVPVGGYTIIRFVTDNPGTWMFHCHLDFHSEIGMAILIKVGSVKDLPKEPIGWPQCGNFIYKDISESSQVNKSNLVKTNISFLLFIFSIINYFEKFSL